MDDQSIDLKPNRNFWRSYFLYASLAVIAPTAFLTYLASSDLLLPLAGKICIEILLCLLVEFGMVCLARMSRIEANQSELIYQCLGQTVRLNWSRIDRIVSVPRYNFAGEIVGSYSAIKNNSGRVLLSLDPLVWGTPEERQAFETFIESQIRQYLPPLAAQSPRL